MPIIPEMIVSFFFSLSLIRFIFEYLGCFHKINLYYNHKGVWHFIIYSYFFTVFLHRFCLKMFWTLWNQSVLDAQVQEHASSTSRTHSLALVYHLRMGKLPLIDLCGAALLNSGLLLLEDFRLQDIFHLFKHLIKPKRGLAITAADELNQIRMW